MNEYTFCCFGNDPAQRFMSIKLTIYFIIHRLIAKV